MDAIVNKICDIVHIPSENRPQIKAQMNELFSLIFTRHLIKVIPEQQKTSLQELVAREGVSESEIKQWCDAHLTELSAEEYSEVTKTSLNETLDQLFDTLTQNIDDDQKKQIESIVLNYEM